MEMLLILALVLGGGGQTHPCDQPPPATVTIASGSPHKAQFCQPQSDNAEAVLGILDAGTPNAANFDLVSVTLKTPTPNVAGLVMFETAAFIQVPKGSHTLTLRAYNKNQATGQSQLGAASDPFPFGAVDETPVPAAPKTKNVVK